MAAGWGQGRAASLTHLTPKVCAEAIPSTLISRLHIISHLQQSQRAEGLDSRDSQESELSTNIRPDSFAVTSILEPYDIYGCIVNTETPFIPVM